MNNQLTMKKSLEIIALAVALMVAQSCGSKSENASEESVAVETAAVTSLDVEVRRTEQRAKLQKDIEVWEAKREIALVELAKITPTYTDAKGNIVYNKAEVEPVFGEGRNSLMKYLKENLVYPEVAKDKGLEGTIFVDFVVAANGNVREAVVTEATSDEVDQLFRNEAIRVVSAMPQWTPGRQHEKPVDVKYSLPISFQLN
jgi:TonB family protein